MSLGILLLSALTISNGIPIANQASSPLADINIEDSEHSLTLLSRQLPDPTHSGSHRTTSQIICSCIATIIASGWIAVRLNLPSPYDSGFQRFRRWIIVTIMLVIAPELIALFATRQAQAAARIKKEFNKRFNGGVDPEISVMESVKRWFTGPPITDSEKVKTGWTMTHGFFVQMGGFMMYRQGKPVKVLTFDRLLGAIENGEIDVPLIPEEALILTSGSSGVPMLVMMLQTVWFMAQCISRWASHLSVSELELFTLAIVMVNMYIWVIWYSKPRGVLSPIRLEFRVKWEPKEEVVLDHPPPNPSPEPNTSSSDTRSGGNSVAPEPATLPSSDLNFPNLHQNSDLRSSTTNRPTVIPSASALEIVDDQGSSGESNAHPVQQQISITPLTSEEPVHKPSMNWLAGQIHKYTDVREEIGPRRRVVLDAPFLIYLFFLCIVRSAWKTMENVDTKVHVGGRDLAIKYQVGRLRVPMFYADRMDNDKKRLPSLTISASDSWGYSHEFMVCNVYYSTRKAFVEGSSSVDRWRTLLPAPLD
ncbi:hypothetical protein NP233_g9376 [Leucocoprinus birnbaumii]|uniref:Uncharacterized protein n=1 Tax=Leucocoprinus birnbaumii TaxID=56174 RepID=A0AAD5VP19_9AGAR|nr:hypothetical protein NP233_g9376 [Leucocoprinus birnbaumii]